jgi:hypothetical protein
VKEIKASAEYSLFMFRFDSEPLARVHAPKALLQLCSNILHVFLRNIARISWQDDDIVSIRHLFAD